MCENKHNKQAYDAGIAWRPSREAGAGGARTSGCLVSDVKAILPYLPQAPAGEFSAMRRKGRQSGRPLYTQQHHHRTWLMLDDEGPHRPSRPNVSFAARNTQRGHLPIHQRRRSGSGRVRRRTKSWPRSAIGLTIIAQFAETAPHRTGTLLPPICLLPDSMEACGTTLTLRVNTVP